MIRIITDSAADFEPHEYARMQVQCIPLTVLFGETVYQETVDLTKDQFYAQLGQTRQFPKTSQPSPQVLADYLEDAKNAGEDAIYISLSSALSGTYQTACMTCEDVGHGYVLDSRNATGGQRILVEHAVKLRDQGCSAKEIIEAVEALRERIVLYACMDTLEYLYYGGRISHTVYKLGSMAQIKPIIRISPQGTVEVPAKAMGMRKGVEYMCRQIQAIVPDPDFPCYAMYTADRSKGEAMAAKLRDLGIQVPDERIMNVGAGIGSHIGPNACGIVYVAE